MSELIDRQQAIDRFNVIRPVDPKKDEYTKGIDVGIAMCIVAVKDQPSAQPVATDTNAGDTISRKAAIDAVRASYDEILDFKSTGRTVADSVEDILTALPSAQPEAQWIPVERGLPEEQGYYITSNEYGGVIEDFYCDDYFWIADRNAYKVIAWMPKPDHYKPNK